LNRRTYSSNAARSITLAALFFIASSFIESASLSRDPLRKGPRLGVYLEHLTGV
jgi:hypothetical protein